MKDTMIQKKKNILGWILKQRMDWDDFWYCRKHDPAEKPLVFGVGLSRTGTRSFHKAMQMLGWNSAHNVRWYNIPQGELIRWTKHSTFNCFCDRPYNHGETFRELHEAFPNAKFVLTVRDSVAWRRSIERWLYDVPEWRDQLLLQAENGYDHLVIEAIPANQLLVLGLREKNKMRRLCAFLDVPYKGRKYPHKNSKKGLFPRQRNQVKSLMIALVGMPLVNLWKIIKEYI